MMKRSGSGTGTPVTVGVASVCSERCEYFGVIRKFARCRMHSARAQDTRSSREYYNELFDDGIPQHASYTAELRTAPRDMGAPPFPRGVRFWRWTVAT